MQKKAIDIFSKIIEWGIIILVFLLPLFFLPITSEAFEFPKQILLAFFVSFLTIIWIARMVLEKSVKVLQSPLTLPILILFLVFFISAIFSVHRFSSIFGPYPRLHGGLVSLVIYLLTFFLITANIKERKQIIRILVAISLSGLILVVIGLFNFFDLYLLGQFLTGRFITPAGSAASTSLFLVFILPILLLTFFFTKRKSLQILSGIASLLFILYVFLINHLAVVLSVFLIFVFTLIFSRLKISRDMAIRMGTLFLICLILLAINNWDFIRSKIPFLKDRPIQQDITLDQNTGWAIAAGGFQNLKLLALGSGPGTYIFDFTSFKPVRFNQTPLWNLRFEKSSNEYFQVISTVGLLGFFALLYFLIVVGRMFREIWRKTIQQFQEKRDILWQVCIFPVIIFFFISIFTPSSTVTTFAFWLFLGLTVSFANLLKLTGIRETEFSIGTVQIQKIKEAKGEILPWLIGLIIVLILVPLLWQEGKIFQAELSFTKARAEQLKDQPNADLILQSLIRARDIAPANDHYRRALSNTSLNFVLLGQQQGLLAEEAKQQLLQTAIIEGEIAARLAPYNIFNWENLQRVYTLISVEGNEEKLINNIFPNELFLDPYNPRHLNDLGLAYLNIRNDIEIAKRYFQDAINLKLDFADAHYNLARIYREEGKKELALQEYEQTLILLRQQIVSIEANISFQPGLGTSLNQLKQLEAQINLEREGLLEVSGEEEEEEPLEIVPPEEGEE